MNGAVKKSTERILVIRLSAIGDIVRTLPSVHALREGFPRAHISWVVEEKGRDVLLDQPEVDEIIVFQRNRWGKGILNPLTFFRTIRELYRFGRELRAKHYDVCLDFHSLLKSGLISYLSGARERVGFARGYCRERCNYLFNNRRVRLRSQRLSRFERNLALVRSLGLDGGTGEVAFHVSKEDIDYVDEFFRSQGLETSRPLVVIHPATSPNTPFKRWPSARYSELADRLVEELGASVVFTWGPGEKPTVDEVRARMRRDSVAAPETHSLKQLGEIFRRCSLYIGGDTGPMHIASLVNTPVVGIFGPSDHVVNAPYEGTPSIMVRKDMPCSPCGDYRRNCQCEHVECMEAVTTQDVFDAARSLLEMNARSRK
jgi:lipopolysaccharide heptosyltransferase I